MTKVTFTMSTSLDGFINGPRADAAHPLGVGGDVLHDWAMGDDERNRSFLEDAMGGVGAVICGRTTYDLSLPFWGPDGPTGSLRRPVIVVTNRPAGAVPEDSVYRFVTKGIKAALQEAKHAAGDSDIVIMGGANTGAQFMANDLIDEVVVSVVPILLGGGTRLFDGTDGVLRKLEPMDPVHTASATHLRYGVIKNGSPAA